MATEHLVQEIDPPQKKEKKGVMIIKCACKGRLFDQHEFIKLPE